MPPGYDPNDPSTWGTMSGRNVGGLSTQAAKSPMTTASRPITGQTQTAPVPGWAHQYPAAQLQDVWQNPGSVLAQMGWDPASTSYGMLAGYLPQSSGQLDILSTLMNPTVGQGGSYLDPAAEINIMNQLAQQMSVPGRQIDVPALLANLFGAASGANPGSALATLLGQGPPSSQAGNLYDMLKYIVSSFIPTMSGQALLQGVQNAATRYVGQPQQMANGNPGTPFGQYLARNMFG